MKVKLFQSRKYEFVWPTKEPEEGSGVEPIPESEKIVIYCQRLGFSQKRDVEDSMVTIGGNRFQSSKSLDEVSMGYSIGTMKYKRIQASVTGWDNVEDEEGNPIKFKMENFYHLLECNGNLDPEVFGVLEEELLDKIEEINSFADTTKVTPEGTEKN